MKNSSVIKFSIGLFFLISTAHAQTDQSNGYLGITVENVSPQIAQMMGKSPDTASSDGAFIFSVATNGPAFKAGLKPGDVITQVNGMPIKNEYDGEADISNIESGQSASISYIREGSIHQVSAVLGSRPNILPNYILAKGDNIWAITQLTSSGTDSNPVLSLDHKTVYFIRTFGPGSGDVSFGPDTQIWSVFTTNGVARPLLKPILSNDPKQNLSGFSNLVLSPDGKILYFITAAWATSGAIRSLNLSTGKVSFITDGNSVCVVKEGNYDGDLIVNQHKYYSSGGSYDDFWLIGSTGKQIESTPLSSDSLCFSDGSQ